MACVLLAGAIASGKSTVAVSLANRMQGEVIRVRDALSAVLGVGIADRRTLQERGAELDRHTNGRWLMDYLEERLGGGTFLVVDSMRTKRQTLPVLEGIPDTILVYLEANGATRRQRFLSAAATDPLKRSMSLAEAMRHPTEREVSDLREMAHLVIETDAIDAEGVVDEIQGVLPSGSE